MARGSSLTICSFCGKSHAEVKKLIAGPGVYICDNCIAVCKTILDKEATSELDTQPQLTIDLGSTTQWDPPQFFTVDSARIEFNTRGGGGGRGAAATPPAEAPPALTSKAFKYKIEVSMDGKEYTQVLDKTNNDVTRYTEFEELPPTRCRFVRLTITDWPKAANPLGVMEFTVFGTPLKNAN